MANAELRRPARARAASDQERITMALLVGPLALWLAIAALGTIDIQGVAQTLGTIGIYLPPVSIG